MSQMCQCCGKRKTAEYEFTCVDCVAKTRGYIDTIVRLSARLSDEAVEQGQATSEVVMLSGAVADPVAYRQRRQYGYRDHWERHPKTGARYRPDVIGEEHPLWTLGMWDLLVRETLGTKSNEAATIENCADHLRDNLWLLARDPDFGFKELKADVKKCARHLENVLGEGDRAERGVPCMYDGRTLERDTELRFVGGKLTGVQSDWTCSKCSRTWTAAEYDARVLAAAWAAQREDVTAWVGMLPVLTGEVEVWCTAKYAARQPQVDRSEGCVKGWVSKHDWPTLCMVSGKREGFVRFADVVQHAEQAGRRERKAAA